MKTGLMNTDVVSFYVCFGEGKKTLVKVSV